MYLSSMMSLSGCPHSAIHVMAADKRLTFVAIISRFATSPTTQGYPGTELAYFDIHHRDDVFTMVGSNLYAIRDDLNILLTKAGGQFAPLQDAISVRAATLKQAPIAHFPMAHIVYTHRS